MILKEKKSKNVQSADIVILSSSDRQVADTSAALFLLVALGKIKICVKQSCFDSGWYSEGILRK